MKNSRSAVFEDQTQSGAVKKIHCFVILGRIKQLGSKSKYPEVQMGEMKDKFGNRVTAEDIRSYVADTYILPRRTQHLNRATFVSGDIHEALRLSNRYPAVCDAIDAPIFLQQNRIVLVSRTQHRLGAHVQWTFQI